MHPPALLTNTYHNITTTNTYHTTMAITNNTTITCTSPRLLASSPPRLLASHRASSLVATAGLKSLLVLSGVTSEEKLLSDENKITPDYYADSIVDFYP